MISLQDKVVDAVVDELEQFRNILRHEGEKLQIYSKQDFVVMNLFEHADKLNKLLIKVTT